jgi:uncharacterized membrane protein (DUF441 family)
METAILCAGTLALSAFYGALRAIHIAPLSRFWPIFEAGKLVLGVVIVGFIVLTVHSADAHWFQDMSSSTHFFGNAIFAGVIVCLSVLLGRGLVVVFERKTRKAKHSPR